MQIKKRLITFVLVVIFSYMGFLKPSLVKAEYKYQLYENYESFGILVFPKENTFLELDQYIRGIGFDPVETGQALMRYGSKRENQTYMMPESVQQKYLMNRFIILQIVSHQNILVGIFDPEWGLTLPSPMYRIDGIKENIPKTLNMFRKHLKKRETQLHMLKKLKRTRLLAKNTANILENVKHD